MSTKHGNTGDDAGPAGGGPAGDDSDRQRGVR